MSDRVYQLVGDEGEKEGARLVPWHKKGRCTTQRVGRRSAQAAVLNRGAECLAS